MKVIIPFAYYYPETCAGISIVDDLVHSLAEEGISSTIYVPTPTRNVRAGAKWMRDEYLCGGMIHIHRFRMYGEGKRPFFRALRYLLCEGYYLYRMLHDDYDVAFIDSTPPIQGLKLPVVKLFRGKPVVHNVQDLFPDTLSGTGLARRGGLIWKIGSLVSKIGLSNSDRIIAISQDIGRNLIEEKGVPADKVEVVYNWVDEKAVAPVADDANPLFEEFSLSRDKFRIVYAGNLGNAQNIDLIVDAAARLKERQDIEFEIFGTGGLEEVIRRRIADEGLHNVNLLPLQPYGRVSCVYSLGNVCIVACKAGLGGSAMPSKTWSILSCGRPVLASFDRGELERILVENRCGLFTLAGDTEGFVRAVETLAGDRRQCGEMGRSGRRFILENLTKSAGTRKYADAIRSVAGNNK